MSAVVGTLCLATAAIGSAWTYRQFRRETRCRWTEHELPILAISLAELSLLTGGLAVFGRFVLDVAGRPLGPAVTAEIALFFVALCVALVFLRLSWRARRGRRARVAGPPRRPPARDTRDEHGFRRWRAGARLTP
ncbi:MAG: hypothetical protein R3322_22795 [Kiloniellales bacterium]|nr:hypothetical protein [Kiloniellales bacterium]